MNSSSSNSTGQVMISCIRSVTTVALLLIMPISHSDQYLKMAKYLGTGEIRILVGIQDPYKLVRFCFDIPLQPRASQVI